MKTAPIFSAATAISLATAGSIVEESTSSVPFFTFLSKVSQITLALQVQLFYYNDHNQARICLLQDAVRARVDFYDIWTRWQHCDDAVCFLCHVCRRVHHLNVRFIIIMRAK